MGVRFYEFGPFRLDPAERLLLAPGGRQELPPRVFDTLLALIENRGRLMEKEDLMRAVWPGAAVEESNLSQTIYLLRKTLHDGESGARFIETVPRRGYRFVAPVRQIEEENAPASPDPPQPPEPAATKGKWLARVGIALVVTMLAVVAARVWLDSVTTRSDLRQIRSIAVLPLLNLTGDPNSDYLADGMTEELITALAQAREWKVVSRTSAMQYKGTNKALPKIGRELGVDAVVEGSVARAGNRVRVTAQLIQASTDRHLWAGSYDGDLGEILTLQARVAEAITGQVKLNLGAAEQQRIRSGRATSVEAQDAYLRGLFHLSRRSPDAFQQAIACFAQSSQKDPKFALAFAGLAESYTLLAFTGEPGAAAKARDAALGALALDESLAEVHTSLAGLDVFEWKWSDAEKEFQRAIALNPNNALAHHWYGNLYLSPLGRHAEAIAELKRALDLDPVSLIVRTDLGFAYYYAGQDHDAWAQYSKVLETDPNFDPVHWVLEQYYFQKGMYEQAARESAWFDLRQGHSIAENKFVSAYARGGRLGLLQLMAHADDPWFSARGYAALGQKKMRSEEHTSELQSRRDLVCRL